VPSVVNQLLFGVNEMNLEHHRAFGHVRGIQGSNTDFLTSACSVYWGVPILSKDKDYLLYRKHLPIELIQPRKNRMN